VGVYDDLAAEEVGKTRNNLGMSLALSSDRNPDTEATFQRISQRTGIPVESLRLDGAKTAKKQELLQQTQDTTQEAPTTARFLSDPANADVSHDDINSLTGIEGAIARFMAPTRDFIRTVGKNLADAPLVPVTMGRAINKGIANTLSNLTGGDASPDDIRVAIPVLDNSIYDQAEQFWKPYIQKAQEYFATPEPSGALAVMNDMGAKGIAGAIKMLPAMGLGTAGMAGQSGLENYDKTENPITASIAAAQSATAMKLMGANKGMAPAKSVAWVSGVSGVESFVSTLARTGDVKEAMQEGVKSAVQMATMDIANRGMMPHPGAVYDSISEQGNKAGLPEEVVDHLAQLSQQTYDYQTSANEFAVKRNQALLEKAGAIAQDSALNQRMTDKFEGLVKGIKDNYQAEDAYVPVEEFDRIFNQGGLDPEEVANTLMSDPSKYSEAKATGTAIQIPLEELVARFSGLPQYAELAKHTALGVGGSSAAEVDLFNAQRDTQVKQFVDKAEQTVKDEAPAQKVYQDIHDKLVAAGRPPEVAHWEALLQSQRQRTRAANRGTGEDGTKHDAWSVYQERPDEIVNSSLEKSWQDATPDELQAKYGTSEVSDFGPVWRDLEHDSAGAIERLKEAKTGEAVSALQHPDVGDIDLVWGKEGSSEKDYLDGYGLSKIIKKHPEVVDGLQNLLSKMEVVSRSKNRITLESEDHKAVVRLEWDGKAKQWLLTEFKKEEEAGAEKRTGTPSISETDSPLHQSPTDSILNQDGKEVKRGAIQIGADRFTISFLEHADLSTFVHESAHQFLEEMAADTRRDDVSQNLKDDFQGILKWMRVSSWDEVQRSHHEQWAKAFEDYLRTGKAPSLELQPAFQRFKGYLLEVYRGIKAHYFDDSKLSPEIAGVMDRMLASEDEINQARQAQDFKQLFATAEEMGMSKAEFASYLKDGAEAGEKAKEDLLKQLIVQMDRERTKTWKEQSKRIGAEVLDEAKQNPVYQAMKVLFTGKDFNDADMPIKMDRGALVDAYGEDFVKKLPKGFGRIYAKEGGWHPDEVAEWFGFDSGDQLLKALTEAPRLKDFVKGETEKRMKEIHGDLMTDGTITEKALEMIHNEKQGEILRAELKAINRKRNEVKPYVDAAKGDAKERAREEKKQSEYQGRWMEAEKNLALAIERGAKQAEIDDLRTQEKETRDKARQGKRLIKEVAPPVEWLKSMASATMAAKKDREIAPFLYSRAEAKHAREVESAILKGDWEAAAEAKYKQLLNHYLFKEAAAVKREVGKAYDFFKKISDRRWLGQNLGKADQGLLNQVQDILARYEFVKTSNVALDNRLQEALKQFEETYGREVPVDESLLYGNEPRNYRDITVEELRALRDSLKVIITAAKQINQIRNDQGAIFLEDAMDQTAESIKASKMSDAPHFQSRSSMTGADKAGKFITGLFDGLQRPERNIFERYDGRADGPMHQFIWNRLLDAKSHYDDLIHELLPDMLEMLDKLPKQQRKKFNDPTGIEIRSMKRSFSHSELVGFALNMGCESNLDKMMRGGIYDAAAERNMPLTPEMINEIKDKLSEDDWHLVQHIWDQLAKLKPHMAELEKRWNGIEPVWVETRPVETKYGSFAGGYYPMVGAPEGSKVGERMQQSAEEFKLKEFANSFASSATRRGHLKERTSAAYAISLDWQNIVTRHLNDVITDIAFREAVFNSNRLLSGEKMVEDPDAGALKVAPVKAAIIKKYGLDEFRNIGKWLEGVVSYSSTGAGPDAKTWESFMSWTRSRATAMHIAYRLDNAVSEAIVGHFFQAWQRLDMKYIVHGALAATVNRPAESWQFAMDNSKYYQHIDQNVNQSFTEAMNKLTGKHDVSSEVMKFGMQVKAYAYKTQAVATFMSAYKQAMETMYQDLPTDEAHAKASRFADKVIRTTTESGSAMDLSAWERHPNGRNFTQWMGPVIIQLNNYIHTVNDVRNGMDAAKATGKAAAVGLASATPSIMRALIGGYLANTIIFPLLKGRSPNLDDDKGKWGTWVLAKLMTGWAEGMPIVREGAGWLESKMTGEFHRMGSFPAAQLAVDAWKLPYDAYKYSQGEAEGKTVAKDALNVGGWVFGLPTSQLGVTGQYLVDALTGNYKPKYPWSPVKDIIYPRPHEK
jgi:hypothetical protein